MTYRKLAAQLAGIGRVKTDALRSLELPENGYACLRLQTPGPLC